MQVSFLFWVILSRNKGNIANQFALDNASHHFFQFSHALRSIFLIPHSPNMQK